MGEQLVVSVAAVGAYAAVTLFLARVHEALYRARARAEEGPAVRQLAERYAAERGALAFAVDRGHAGAARHYLRTLTAERRELLRGLVEHAAVFGFSEEGPPWGLLAFKARAFLLRARLARISLPASRLARLDAAIVDLLRRCQ